jgi:hypothetical protein
VSVPRWQLALVAVVTIAGAAGAGAVLRPGASIDQATTLTAVQDQERYSFVMRAAGVADLYPGADRRLVLTMTNPYAFDLLVTDVRTELVGTTKPGCEPVPANLLVGAYAGDLPVRIGAGDERETGAVALRMPNSVVDACQEAGFRLAVHADATRDAR